MSDILGGGWVIGHAGQMQLRAIAFKDYEADRIAILKCNLHAKHANIEFQRAVVN